MGAPKRGPPRGTKSLRRGSGGKHSTEGFPPKGFFSIQLRHQVFALGEGSLKRVVTGLVLIPIVVYIVLFTSELWILAVSTAITLLALLELNGLTLLKIRDSLFDYLLVAAGAATPPLVYLYGLEAFLPVVMASLFAFFLYGMASARELKDSVFDVSFKTLGMAYIALPLSYLALIRGLENGEYWLLFLLVVIWADDTFAYFTGRWAGRHKLCPEISPKKTIEGAVGGLIGGAIAALVFDNLLSMGLGLAGAVILSLIIGVIGIIGDLAESLLKRGAGVKDSGGIIPGHGGMLDRVDSLLFPIPVLYYFLIFNLAAL